MYLSLVIPVLFPRKARSGYSDRAFFRLGLGEPPAAWRMRVAVAAVNQRCTTQLRV